MQFAKRGLMLAAALQFCANAPAVTADDDQRFFRDYLSRSGMSELWTRGALRIDSPELRQAYPGLRFYYTYQPEPLPPGAPMPEALTRYNEAREKYRAQSLRLTVAIDDAGVVRALRTPADFNEGLTRVGDAKE